MTWRPLSSTPYFWRSCANPYEQPDPPELDDIDERFHRSECCGGSIVRTKNNRNICEHCGLFCKIDDDATLDAYWSSL